MEKISQKSVFKVLALIIMLFISLFIINMVTTSFTQINRENIVRNVVGADTYDCLKNNKEKNEIARKEIIENNSDLKEEERIITRTNIISYLIQILALYIFAYLIVHILNNEKSNKAVK